MQQKWETGESCRSTSSTSSWCTCLPKSRSRAAERQGGMERGRESGLERDEMSYMSDEMSEGVSDDISWASRALDSILGL